ncbi:hypothetical protein ABT121_01505 [Streptomyces sp. NPDC001928]|uniref:hypothetical protein n=1 Tax=Streptomyces sp. NPDC001928 TaxID=3154404 RepID=UPI003317318F
MTHDPDHEHQVGGEPAGTDFEVLTGPGGPEREQPRGAALRGLWQRRSGRARAVTAAATVAALALGGTVAYAATSSGSGEGPSPAASGPASPSPGAPGERHGPGRWFGLGGAGVHGESTVKDPDSDEWVVRIWQRGTVEKVDGNQVTVKSEDGAEWTWTVGSDTTVRHDGDKGSAAGDLKKGDDIFLVGTRSDDDTRTAARVLAGNWEEWKREKGEERDGGPGDWRGKFPGPRHWDRPGSGPSESQSHSGATT